METSKSHVTLSMIRQPTKTICFIDSNDSWAGSPVRNTGPNYESVASADRHNNGWCVSFCDGHVGYFRSMPSDKARQTGTESGDYLNQKYEARSVIGKNDYYWALNKAGIPTQ